MSVILGVFRDGLKEARVSSLFQKNYPMNKTIFRPVSIPPPTSPSPKSRQMILSTTFCILIHFCVHFEKGLYRYQKAFLKLLVDLKCHCLKRFCTHVFTSYGPVRLFIRQFVVNFNPVLNLTRRKRVTLGYIILKNVVKIMLFISSPT